MLFTLRYGLASQDLDYVRSNRVGYPRLLVQNNGGVVRDLTLRSRADMLLDSVPILAEQTQGFTKLEVLLVGPSSRAHIDSAATQVLPLSAHMLLPFDCQERRCNFGFFFSEPFSVRAFGGRRQSDTAFWLSRRLRWQFFKINDLLKVVLKFDRVVMLNWLRVLLKLVWR